MQSPVPALSHSLKALSAILATAEAHCTDHKIDPTVMLAQRLFPNMLPLMSQIRIASDTAKGACARLAQLDVPSFADDETTFADLQARITKTLDFIAPIPAAAYEGAEDRTITLKIGKNERTFSGAQYYSGFVMPNFYFHAATAYNILRHNGVGRGKKDFLGA